MSIQSRNVGTVARWSPWSDLDRVQSQIDEAFGRLVGAGSPAHATLTGRLDAELSPDVYETEAEFVFAIPAPGLDAETLSIEALRDSITLKGERKPLVTVEGGKLIRQSIWSAAPGAFHWQFNLPADIDPDRVSATWKNGVLVLHLPKPESARSKSVKVAIESA
ncbi:MAG: Hsp20/alpha crystallin family protein [Armatimonadetes bacterium]|nr:Hsp20/alpha crystallin family protein [Armatimonadota bacterium]MDE2206043.1 Hsp20/alpha crystallin family protein [Armatimonadota bacterium]